MTDHLSPSSNRSLLTAKESLVVSRTVGALTQLFILDDHWTRAAAAISTRDDKSQTGPLGEIVAEMDTLLAQSPAVLGEIADVFRNNADRMRSTYVQLIAPAARSSGEAGRRRGLTDGDRLMLRDIVDKFGGGDIAEAAIRAAERASAADRVATERQALRIKMRALANEGRSKGDLSQEEWTDLALVAAGASVVFGPEAGAVVLAAGGLADLAADVWHSLFG